MKIFQLLATTLFGLAVVSVTAYATNLAQGEQSNQQSGQAENILGARTTVGHNLSGKYAAAMAGGTLWEFSSSNRYLSISGSSFETLVMGECAPGRIAQITQRLTDAKGQPIPGSGSMIIIRGAYGPKLYLMSYQELPDVIASRVNDPVAVCLISVPRHCPPEDTRGRIFRVMNLRTHETWSMPNSEHSCGGS